MNLYSKFANKFSEKRQIPWKGWEKVLPYLKEKQPLTLLDLGCGNARLLKTITNYELLITRYIGVDSSKILLNIAKKSSQLSVVSNQKPEDKQTENREPKTNIYFVETDLEGDNWDNAMRSTQNAVRFNVICSFGLMHHIKNEELRFKILDKAIKMLEEGGYLIMSFWQFKDFPEFMKKHLIGDLGSDNYILSFGGKESGATRFCHSFSNEELENIDENFKNLQRVGEFSVDGVENKMNKYIVWQRS